jgi:hypothetical protein
VHRRFLLFLEAATAAVAAALAPVAIASAHVVYKVGTYYIAMGWEYEPSGGTVTYVGQPNGIQVFVDTQSSSGDIGSPVSDLNADCTKPDFQVTVTYAGKTSSPQCPSLAYDPDTGLGRRDEYDAVMTPTKVGDYTFHIVGTIHGVHIDKTSTSSDKTFDSVGDQSQVEFPASAPALSDVAAKVNSVSSRADDATNAANRAFAVGIAAVIVALVLGTATLVVSLRRRP